MSHTKSSYNFYYSVKRLSRANQNKTKVSLMEKLTRNTMENVHRETADSIIVAKT